VECRTTISLRSFFSLLLRYTLPSIDRQAISLPALQFAAADIAREAIHRRIAAGMTQQELAKRVGVRPETISRLESAKHLPRIETMERIDRVLPPPRRPRSSVA
jgi:DNA-binding XRE family transcriptional regulator